MRILYLHQYFNTREGTGGTRSYEMARRLAANGHEVSLITSGLHASPRFAITGSESHRQVEIDGIRVVSIPAAYNDPRFGTTLSAEKRLRAFYEFALVSFRIGCTLSRPDLVFATHTPLTIGFAGSALARHFAAPFVFEVRDLWPASLVNLGILQNGCLTATMRAIEKGLCQQAARVVTLSPGMRKGILQHDIASERIAMIPNGADVDLFGPHIDGTEKRQSLALKDDFVAIYFGAMGRANGLHYVLDAAKVLLQRGRNRIRIILHGAGSEKQSLICRAQDEGLNNIVFSDPVLNKSELAKLVAASNACLTIYAGENREQSWSPNKFFDALAAGKPILVNVGGWLSELVEDNRCGQFVDPTRPKSLADALISLADAPEMAAAMGRRSRSLAEREFSRDNLADRFERLLQEVESKS